MAGRTNVMADKALGLYKGITAHPVSQMWVTLFTTNPSIDHGTSHAAVEWGPPRKRIFPDSGAGSPSWGAIFDYSTTVRAIQNSGSVSWTSIALTVSPSTMVGVGYFDAATGGSLLTWYPIPLADQFTKLDGQDVVIAPTGLKILED